MKWLIGLDLRPSSRGAVSFARWLADASSTDTFAAVHVLEESYLMQVLRREHLAEVEGAARTEAQAVLAAAGLQARVTGGPSVVRGDVADKRLEAEVENLEIQGLVIGRQAKTDDIRLVRLGRVARRLVRRASVPTIVVPPDLEVGRVGPGPVLLATDMGEQDEAALRFAQGFAERCGRPLVVAHVLPELGGGIVAAATLQQLYDQLGLERERDVKTWLRDHGLGETPVILAQGDVVSRLASIAASEHAPIIVCGSRRLSMAERLFVASIGSELACHADCAVAIVPPDAPR